MATRKAGITQNDVLVFLTENNKQIVSPYG